VVTVAFAPVALLLFRQSRNRGASVARPLAGLLLIWPVWFLASVIPDIVPFARASLWLTIVFGAVYSWSLAWRKGVITRTALRHFAIAEAIFLVCFVAFIGFHGYGPAIWDQEKPSDLMMLSSSMRAQQMPPQDAWLAGETINYYYLGYLVLAGFAKLAGTTPGETYNLALATLFGMTVAGLFGIADNVLGPLVSERKAWIAGGLATMFVVILGNPWAALEVLKDPEVQWNADLIPGKANEFVKGIGWKSTRIIFDNARHEPITEFPFFTFILSDLHPHLIALPFTVMALAFAWMLLRIDSTSGTSFRDLLPYVALAGGAVGALYGINAWDFPTYLLINAMALLIGLRSRPWTQRMAAAAVLAVTAVVCWSPFYAGFTSPTRPADTALANATEAIPLLGGIIGSVALFDADRTSIAEYLSMFGFMYVIAAALIVSELRRRRAWPQQRAGRLLILATAILLVLGSVLLSAPLLVLLGYPLAACIFLISRDRCVTATNGMLGALSVAFVLTLSLEFLYLRDFFDTRMNSVFKIYFQVWVLMGIASAVSVVLLWSWVHRTRIQRWALAAAMAVILVGGVTYPVVAGKQWLDWRSPEREWVGIDGLDYLNRTDQRGEYAAIDWLWNNAKPEDVMLSAGGCEWSASIGRPAAATGIPTILGWTGHEVQWHLNPEDSRATTTQRASDINTLFRRLPSDLLDKYGVTLIYIGATETQGGDKPPGPGCAPGPFANAMNPDFPGPGWTEVFSGGDVRIYRRDGS
jgi:YYY domain-containing protein